MGRLALAQPPHDGERLEDALSSPYDVILLDVGLPGIDGFEVLRRIRAQSLIPVMMLTARGDDVDRIIGLELGADDYLSKPVNPDKLTSMLKIWFQLKRSTA